MEETCKLLDTQKNQQNEIVETKSPDDDFKKQDS